MTLNGQWIELFRAGNYGEKGAYTEADIDKMVANYDPAKHEAPVVVGHPEHDAPAFGWVESLKRAGSVLLGKLKQVPAQFEDLVREGRFKKRSISLYRTADGPALRHVGFLGAMPPEVKGLADVKLASFGSGKFEAIEFVEEGTLQPDEISKPIIQSLKDFFAELFKGKRIENLSEGDQAKAIETAVAAAVNPLTQKFTELEKKVTEASTANATASAAAASQAQVALAEKQVQRVKDARRWLPAFDKMGLPAIFSELAKSPAKISFGEGDKKAEKPACEAFADFMINLGEMVPSGELVPGQARAQGTLVQFNEPADRNTVVDQDSAALAEAAQEMVNKSNGKTTFGEALRQLRRSGKYAVAGGSSSGAV